MTLGKEEIENRFGFHKATIEGSNATLPKHRDVRILFREFAEKLDEVLPEGRTKEFFWTHLETASMWSHKAIAELAPVVEEPAELTPQQVQLSNLFGTGQVGYKQHHEVTIAEISAMSTDDLAAYRDGRRGSFFLAVGPGSMVPGR